MDRVSAFMLQEIEFSCVFYFFDTEKFDEWTDQEMFDKSIEAQYQQRIVS